MFKKILIANRGETAVRIIRTCKEMGIGTVAIYSDVDADCLHVKLADEAYEIEKEEAIKSYLNTEKILLVAERCQAEAIHPGYGFLAENPEFVEECEERGITFIGPPAECMHKAKPKQNARQLMRRIKIPVVPGYDETLMNSTTGGFAKVQEVVDSIGYPVVIKPSGGAGGIGITVARNPEELTKAIQFVEDKGRRLFGISSFYIERLLYGIKHIEFQVLADKYGNIVSLGERDCSVQRRFQKMLEEAPCHILSPHLRMKMAVAALDIALALQYINALTVEFFYIPGSQEFYFSEVDTALQVEHSVTELTSGIDIVKEQIRIAAGEPLPYTQDDINTRLRAIECRITAEDVSRNFLPSPGTITNLHLPQGIGIRIDEGVYEGYRVPFNYDSLLLKVMAWGNTREEAVSRMKRALAEMKIEGIKTTIPFHRLALEDEAFISGYYTTDFVDKRDMVRRVHETIAHLKG
jgi:acetyl-CoA carboxylase biotin carboxylase subunit